MQRHGRFLNYFEAIFYRLCAVLVPLLSYCIPGWAGLARWLNNLTLKPIETSRPRRLQSSGENSPLIPSPPPSKGVRLPLPPEGTKGSFQPPHSPQKGPSLKFMFFNFVTTLTKAVYKRRITSESGRSSGTVGRRR